MAVTVEQASEILSAFMLVHRRARIKRKREDIDTDRSKPEPRDNEAEEDAN